MRLRFLFTILVWASAFPAKAQLISIADAHLQPYGSTVTVNGDVTSGFEFGTIRYMQDGTGGIAIFSSALSSTMRGDNVTVTGVTVDYQNLLELNPVNSWTLNSSGNPSPVALTLIPSQLAEANESMLIRIDNVSFQNGGTVFQGNTTYSFTASGEPGVVYIRSTNPLVGTTVPTTNITLYGICSHYGSQYQVLPRDINDLVTSAAISITVPPYPQSINTTSFEIAWQTDVSANTFLRYGHTTALELGTLTGPVNTTTPVVQVTGGQPSELYYIQAYSVAGTDTAFSGIKAMITASNSTGTINAYFNRPADTFYAIPTTNMAIQLPDLFADTLKAYMDRAMSTLDIAIYSFDVGGPGTTIVQAVNDAYSRGVQVRVITEGGNSNSAIAQLNPAIPVVLSPQSPPLYYGIMHNKFFIIDANHLDASLPMVMTGSTNWTEQQLNDDRNNVVFIQDQSLAKVYTMEFEEMWGSSGLLPDPLNAKFGPDKTDNTPHDLMIGGKRLESYFSPSDNVNNQILRTIETADDELYFATMVFTRYDLAYGVEAAVNLNGVYAAGIMNDSSGGSGQSFLIMQGAMGSNIIEFDHASQPGILHHKYLIVDQGTPGYDPLVLTGSHNWSSAANQRNDENTVIIHSSEIANQFYQEFHGLFTGSGGVLSVQEHSSPILKLFPVPASNQISLVWTSVKNEKIETTLTDLSGKIVHRQIFECTPGLNMQTFETSSFAPGTYLIRITGSTKSETRKFVIGH